MTTTTAVLILNMTITTVQQCWHWRRWWWQTSWWYGAMKPLNGGESRCDGLTPPPPNPTPTKLIDIVCHRKSTNSTSRNARTIRIWKKQILLWKLDKSNLNPWKWKCCISSFSSPQHWKGVLKTDISVYVCLSVTLQQKSLQQKGYIDTSKRWVLIQKHLNRCKCLKECVSSCLGALSPF